MIVWRFDFKSLQMENGAKRTYSSFSDGQFMRILKRPLKVWSWGVQDAKFGKPSAKADWTLSRITFKE